jgi:hypothetical protein
MKFSEIFEKFKDKKTSSMLRFNLQPLKSDFEEERECIIHHW